MAAISFCDIYAERSVPGPEGFQRAHRSISDEQFAQFVSVLPLFSLLLVPPPPPRESPPIKSRYLVPPEQKERTEALVIEPLNQLLLMFAGPHKLIQKRFDKLLDYDNCKERADRLKDRRVQDELQAARNNYEALNAQLLDELPKFHGAAEDLFTGCVRAFAQSQKDFMKRTLGELTPLVNAVRNFVFKGFEGSGTFSHARVGRIRKPVFKYFPFRLQFSNKAGTEGNLISKFQEEYGRVLQLLQSFSFCPENLPPATSTKKTSERKTLERPTSRKLQAPVSFIPFDTA